MRKKTSGPTMCGYQQMISLVSALVSRSIPLQGFQQFGRLRLTAALMIEQIHDGGHFLQLLYFFKYRILEQLQLIQLKLTRHGVKPIHQLLIKVDRENLHERPPSLTILT